MNQNGQIRYTCVSSFPYSPFASRSLAVSQPNLIPHFVAGPSRSSPSGRRLWYGFLVRSHSTLAAFPAIQCRCGRSVSQQPFRQASLVRIPHPVHFHTGSISRDSVPLRQVRLAGRSVSQQPFRQASLVRIPRPVPFHTGSVSRDSVLLWKKRHGKNLKELFRKTASK